MTHLGRMSTGGLVAALLLAPCAPAAPQQSSAAPHNWRAVYPPNLGDLPTPAERATAMAILAEIEDILARVPSLAQPKGFEVWKQVYGGTFPLGEKGPLTYRLFLWFFVPSKAVEPEGPKCIGVNVNSTAGLDLDAPEEHQKGFFIEPEIGGEKKPGVTIIHEGLRWDTPTEDRRGGSITITAGGAFPWLQVTREQYLQRQIYWEEGKNGQTEAEIKSSLAKTSYQRWMEGAAERKKTREAAIATADRTQGAAAAEELRKTLEATEREVTENMKAEEPEERKRNEDALANRHGDVLRAQLAAMTPAERASPAVALFSGQMVAADDPLGHRVLTPDPEFFRVRRSRAEAHSITLGFSPTLACADPAVRAALWEAYQTIDWSALRAIVDRSR